ncbi:1-hydroxycarotenoid 3,4-desaturase CrtD [Elioraea rosea]|uniref:1-hydroxycarotenoid 3,4-desaturase CrtD n=1 Tax=Elioraea rosea TaxID=2492390 RepID=UPI0011821AF5|nr:1-hydroxycarotenoid 3,4-desaturase CrtD [Elioraea rosea]
MAERHVVVIGAGMGGLAAALDLARQGARVTVLERAAAPGGKMREVMVAGRPVDSGPTVFTMRWVLEALFAEAGVDFGALVPTEPLDVLARHAWRDGARLDLHADRGASEEAIGAFAGAAEARGYRDFIVRAGEIYRTLEDSFMTDELPSPIGLARRVGVRGLPGLMRISPFATLWDELGRHFRDGRLRQLFGRYATYCGASPFAAPATLMLIAHVEQEGVWAVQGGMHRIARALAGAVSHHGGIFRYGVDVAAILERSGRACGVRLASGEAIEADAVIANVDHAALREGRFGDGAASATAGEAPPRSLSAVTWSLAAKAEGFPLLHHNVFFSEDYRSEFDQIVGQARLPDDPTIYVCAQDRGAGGVPAPDAAERFLVLVNAPATGDRGAPSPSEIAQCEERTFGLLARAGLSLSTVERVVTTPATFHAMFPATGGALYGRALHGWAASFQRPGARTRLPGLFLAGGSIHPGPGVPMAALSGRIAAAAAAEHLRLRSGSTRGFGRAGISGGISTG